MSFSGTGFIGAGFFGATPIVAVTDPVPGARIVSMRFDLTGWSMEFVLL